MAVLVLWSNDAVKSQWVRAEADAARELGTLVQVSLDGVLPPMPFNQIQCADLFGWTGDTSWPGWHKVVSSIASLDGTASQAAEPRSSHEVARRVICVLPFVNMSGDAEQEYFSDGISEDIITDLSKVSALTIIGRNTVFSLKGKPVDMQVLGRDLGTTHVLEGSVRKAGTRVRINAQLTDCMTGHQLWADRYDRDLTDIFAIQDEISKAIVAALQLKLLPKEKKAIEQRGTGNSGAYNLYLMARQHWISGNDGDSRRDEAVVRICRQVVELDPNYAHAWALMALAQSELRFRHDKAVDPLPAAEKALELDPDLAEAYCVKARYLAYEEDQREESERQIATALRLDPESWEVNKEAAMLVFLQGRTRDAIPYFEKAASLMEGDYHSTGLLMTCYKSLNDPEGVRRFAERTFSRAEKVVAHDSNNGSALGYGAMSLAAMGESDRAREWAQRALLIDPEHLTLRYNLACSFALLGDPEAAMDLLLPYADAFNAPFVTHFQVDPDLDALRGDSRFEQMLAGMKARIAAAAAD
jgi:adenylate cyclase